MIPPDRHGDKRPKPRQTSRSPSKRGVSEISVSEISKRVLSSQQRWREFLDYADSRTHTRWIFRGCGSPTHLCQPSVGRVPNYDPVYEERVFRAFKRTAKLYVAMTSSSDWDWLALAQHH